VQVESRPGQGTSLTLTLPPYPVANSGLGTVGLDLSEPFTTP